jgi:hypothetical protein
MKVASDVAEVIVFGEFDIMQHLSDLDGRVIFRFTSNVCSLQPNVIEGLTPLPPTLFVIALHLIACWLRWWDGSHLENIWGPSWSVLGSCLSSLGAMLGPSWVVLGPSCGHIGLSWTHLGVSLGR